MAERPIFIPAEDPRRLVDELSLPLKWHSGFASVQKKKNIAELHAAAKALGIEPILEVSTKSSDKVGQRLSAFSLKIPYQNQLLPIETAFQGSKVFRFAGPFNDLYTADPREAKRDDRLRKSGELIGFEFGAIEFPIRPVTAFYDWLYLNAIYPHREWLSRLDSYRGFSDIEFNPQKSVNCQARSCALFFSLRNKGILSEALSSPHNFIKVLQGFSYMCELPANDVVTNNQLKLDGIPLGLWISSGPLDHAESSGQAQELFRVRASRARKGALRDALSAIPDRDPDPGDELEA